MTTTPTSGAAIQRYKIGYHAEEWSQRSRTPSGIPDASGSWVRYADHVTALAAGQATAPQGAAYAALPDEGEPWRGHKFKEVQRGCWRCDCGKTIKEVTSDQSTPASGGNYPVMPKRYTVDDDGEELFTADKMRAFADATHTLSASHGQAPAGAAEEIDKALNVYAQAFAARVNGWTRQNGDDLPGARSALFAAIHAYARASTRPTTSPQADNKNKAPL